MLLSSLLLHSIRLCVALQEFQAWYQDYAETWNQQALHNQNWLQPISASQPELADYFPHVRTVYDSTVIALQEDWSIPTYEDDTRKQHVITQCMKDKLKAAFVSDLPLALMTCIELSKCPSAVAQPDLAHRISIQLSATTATPCVNAQCAISRLLALSNSPTQHFTRLLQFYLVTLYHMPASSKRAMFHTRVTSGLTCC